VNAPVKFAIKSEDFYLQDEDGKEHKLYTRKLAARQPPPNQPMA